MRPRSAPAIAAPARRNFGIDCLRGLAILLVTLAVLSVLALFGTKGYAPDAGRQSLAGLLGAGLSFTFNWYEGRTGWAPAGWDVPWSLSIEEAFYLGFPLLCLWLPRGLLVGLPGRAGGPAGAALAAHTTWRQRAGPVGRLLHRDGAGLGRTGTPPPVQVRHVRPGAGRQSDAAGLLRAPARTSRRPALAGADGQPELRTLPLAHVRGAGRRGAVSHGAGQGAGPALLPERLGARLAGARLYFAPSIQR